MAVAACSAAARPNVILSLNTLMNMEGPMINLEIGKLYKPDDWK